MRSYAELRRESEGRAYTTENKEAHEWDMRWAASILEQGADHAKRRLISDHFLISRFEDENVRVRRERDDLKTAMQHHKHQVHALRAQVYDEIRAAHASASLLARAEKQLEDYHLKSLLLEDHLHLDQC